MFVINVASCNEDDIADLYVGLERDDNNQIVKFGDINDAKEYVQKIIISRLEEEEVDGETSEMQTWEWKVDERGTHKCVLLNDFCWFEIRIEEI